MVALLAGDEPGVEEVEAIVALEDLIAMLEADDRLVFSHRLPAREPRFGQLARPLPEVVQRALGVEHLWSHQAETINALRAGRSAVIASGTGSGKSLCYQAVIAEAATTPVRARTSLLLFPTKALAQDQARALLSLGIPRLAVGTYDGDTSPEQRAWARRQANVVLTNPEMLHHGIIPHHQRWASFLSRLSYIVVDELHVLRGIFGSHVAHILRRLRRLCAHYGSNPTFVFASATIGEPGRLASELCGLDVEEILDDGSPKSERALLLWNPPMADTFQRASHISEAASLAASLIRSGRRTIVFCRSRKGTELTAAELRRRLPARDRDRVRPYRGGYLAEERREIEHQLFSGQLRGVVATSALELGVDISGLDAAVLSGFPGTVASMWQQLGRAGRGEQASVGVIVAGEDQLDQWLVRHPRELLNRPAEAAVINSTNPFILLPHLECAAAELPLSPSDARYWPDHLDEAVRRLVRQDRLVVRHRRRGSRSEPLAAWNGSGWPSREMSLRSSSRAEISIQSVDEQRVIGTVDEARATQLVHPGAIYLHQGAVFEVVELDLDRRIALVEPATGDFYTVPRTSISFRILDCDEEREFGGATIGLGPLQVRTQVTGYHVFDVGRRTSSGIQPLQLPAVTLQTRGVWYSIPDELLVRSGLASAAVPGSLHALEHAAIGMLPLFAICDRWDVGGVSTALQAELGTAAITIYDGYPGGAGIAELAFAAFGRHLQATLDAIEACRCATGCPSCVQSPKCGNGNDPLDKTGAAQLARQLLEP